MCVCVCVCVHMRTTSAVSPCPPTCLRQGLSFTLEHSTPGCPISFQGIPLIFLSHLPPEALKSCTHATPLTFMLVLEIWTQVLNACVTRPVPIERTICSATGLSNTVFSFQVIWFWFKGGRTCLLNVLTLTHIFDPLISSFQTSKTSPSLCPIYLSILQTYPSLCCWANVGYSSPSPYK